MRKASDSLHLNYTVITNIIEQGSKVLDLGCGNGTLLKMLVEEKQCSGLGVDINQNNVIESIQKGLSIVQGDIDEGLKEFGDKEFDYVILNQTLQTTEKPDYVIDAIDTMRSKIDLLVYCKENNIPVITSMGAGNRLDPTKLYITDIKDIENKKCTFTKNVLYQLKKRGIDSGITAVCSKEAPNVLEKISVVENI